MVGLSSVRGSPRTGADQLALVRPQHHICPDRPLIKTFNKEENKIKEPSLPFRVLCWSFLPSPWMSPPYCHLSQSPSHPLQLPGGPWCPHRMQAEGHSAEQAQTSPPSASLTAGSADGAVPATTSRPGSSASPALRPRDPGRRGARARSGPPRPTWARWHSGLAQLQRQAAEPGRMTSPE